MFQNVENKKITICAVVDYERDIKPYPLVKIYSGVGSGKSFFASAMITGVKEYGIPRGNVLIVTSRRAKVEETLKELGVFVTERITKNGNLSFEVLQTGEDRPYEYEKYAREIAVDTGTEEVTFLTYDKSVVCTNAYISAYLRHVYDPENPITHIWNRYDAIIIDEAHSLVTDSTYQSAAFDVYALIREYLHLRKNNLLQENACQHLILMTGTPQPFEALAEFDFPEELTHEMVLFDQCENVVPKNIVLVEELSSKIKIKELLSKGEKVIYFSNQALTENEVRKKLEIPEPIKIGVSFSNEKKKKKISDKDREAMNNINENLSNRSMIPDDIQLFVSTSRNKEGINIHNTDFQNMFVETHLMYDVVQMAGRVRSGVENLHIITDAKQLQNNHSVTDILFSKKVMVANSDYSNSNDEANNYFVDEYLENEKELTKPFEERKRNAERYIDYIEGRFSYVKFNVFSRKFEFFYMKENAEEMEENQRKEFSNMVLSESDSYIKLWFPKSNVRREVPVEEKGKIYLERLLGKNKWVYLSNEELDRTKYELCRLLNTELISINSILHLVDKEYMYVKSGKKHLLYYGEDPRIKKKPMKRKQRRRNH